MILAQFREINPSDQFKEKANNLLFEKFGSGIDEIKNTNGMWKIESKDPMGGGVVSWGNPVRLKHLRYFFFLQKHYIKLFS